MAEPSVMAHSAFPSFTSSLEAVHGGVHVWVRGTMSMIPTAPADLIFWMHHANIDRLWWQWRLFPQPRRWRESDGQMLHGVPPSTRGPAGW